MAETNQTPLWLDLKKEYIDDNFNIPQGLVSDISLKTDNTIQEITNNKNLKL